MVTQLHLYVSNLDLEILEDFLKSFKFIERISSYVSISNSDLFLFYLVLMKFSINEITIFFS